MEAVARTIEGKAIPRPTRVLMVVPPAGGGLAQHVVALLRGLAAEGYQAAVCCEPESLVAEAAEALSFPVHPVRIAAEGPSRTLMSVVQVARAVGSLQAQIVHTHSFRAGLVGALVMPGAGGARLAATIHNFPPGPPEGRAKARRRDRWAVQMLLRRADRLITVSDALRRELAELRPRAADKMLTIPNGVDTTKDPVDQAAARRLFDLNPLAPVIGMVARLAPEKGIPQFLRCCQVVSQQRPEAQFLLAGDGPLREQVEADRGKLGLEDRVRLLGEVDALHELLAALDVLVVASTTEGSSVVAMQAMCQQRPVVATRVGGVPEVVSDGETGILVEPENHRELARGVLTLLDDADLRARMGVRGRQRVKELFDMQDMVARVKEVYADLVRADLEKTGGEK